MIISDPDFYSSVVEWLAAGVPLGIFLVFTVWSRYKKNRRSPQPKSRTASLLMESQSQQDQESNARNFQLVGNFQTLSPLLNGHPRRSN